MTPDELRDACRRLEGTFLKGETNSLENHLADCRAVSRALLAILDHPLAYAAPVHPTETSHKGQS